MRWSTCAARGAVLSRCVMGMGIVFGVLGAGPGFSAEPLPATTADTETVPEVGMPQVVVSATRTPQSIATIPGSVTVITEQQIQQQNTISPTRALNDLLGKLVPGFSQADQSTATSFAQTLRGPNQALNSDAASASHRPRPAFGFLVSHAPRRFGSAG